jgi:hypothetical protein
MPKLTSIRKRLARLIYPEGFAAPKRVAYPVDPWRGVERRRVYDEYGHAIDETERALMTETDEHVLAAYAARKNTEQAAPEWTADRLNRAHLAEYEAEARRMELVARSLRAALDSEEEDRLLS